MENRVLGKRLKERRIEMNMSADQLARRLGMSKATIYRYESGEIKDIKVPIIEAMAAALRINPLWLSGESNVKHVNAQRDFATSIKDLIIFLDTVEDLKYKGIVMDEKDLTFLRQWTQVVDTYFKSRYK